jgi:hypothetical protein
MMSEYSNMFGDHSNMFREHSNMFREHSNVFREHSNVFREHSNMFGEHNNMFGEHSNMFRAINLLATGFKCLQSTLAYDIIFARHLNFGTQFYKKIYYSKNQKSFNNGLNGIFWEIRQSHFCVCSRNQ